jgi:hypothetical protein
VDEVPWFFPSDEGIRLPATHEALEKFSAEFTPRLTLLTPYEAKLYRKLVGTAGVGQDRGDARKPDVPER